MINLEKVKNKILTCIESSIYFESKISTLPRDTIVYLDGIIDICLTFEDCQLTISCDQIGQNILMDYGNNLKQIDMKDDGYIGILDISTQLNLSSYIGKKLEKISYNQDEQGIDNGVVFHFYNQTLMICNIGDQLVLYTDFN